MLETTFVLQLWRNCRNAQRCRHWSDVAASGSGLVQVRPAKGSRQLLHLFGIGILLAAIAQHQNLMISWNESETPMLERTGDNV
jgi:hypothetical protein